MWDFVFSGSTQWTVLVLGVVLAAFAGRKRGRLAVVGVFCAVWALLYAFALVRARHFFELNPIADVMTMELPPPTLAACLTAIPVLWTTGRASVRRSATWGVATATLVSFALPIALIYATLIIPAGRSPCILLSLESSIPSRTVRGVSTTGFFTDTCPTPIANELAFDRDYGTLEIMQLPGTRHRLLISGRTPDDDPLRVGVERLDPTGGTWVPPHAPASKVVTLSQTRLDPSDPRLADHAEKFSVTVFRADGALLEEIPLRYIPHTCTCVYFDSL